MGGGILCLGGLPNTDWAGKAGLVRDQESYLVTAFIHQDLAL